LPILLALYQAIILALAGTPFQLIDLSGRLLVPGLDDLVPLNNIWLDMDLTLPPTANPLYALLLPLLVMVTTWLQSKLTIPTPPPSDDGKPNQAAMMTRSMTTIMPLMFGFFSLSFSVGLSIYFVVSNLVGILQYTLMGRAEWGRLLGREPADEPAPAVVKGSVAKSSAKKADKADKTDVDTDIVLSDDAEDTTNSSSKKKRRKAKPKARPKSSR